MPLTADTSLAQALRADPGLADRLAEGLGPDNALSRLLESGNVPAGRIHLADAAAIAGVPVERLLELAGAAPAAPPAPAPAPAANDWFAQAERTGAATVDVRPMLAEGRDPFAAVLQAADAVPPGGYLILEAPFDPAPLRRVLAGKGLMSQGRPAGPGHWRICFHRDGGPPDDSDIGLPTLRKPGEAWREGDVMHIEVRGLVPPGPMTAVLRLIEAGEAQEIVVHHDRDPMLLYPELEERAWECVRKTTHGDEIRLLLRPIAD
ncbi:DUF2249 domain-containing protein [Azospirillum sp.]|uniref:DUF2249 domain-containing protein n=1 Tax=Azospirillum sp. TaxID=34012 RepID=UPI003D715466